MTEQPMEFDNGMSESEKDFANEAIISLSRWIDEIEKGPRHRSYSLAITKLEEAKHWLRDRFNKPA